MLIYLQVLGAGWPRWVAISGEGLTLHPNMAERQKGKWAQIQRTTQPALVAPNGSITLFTASFRGDKIYSNHWAQLPHWSNSLFYGVHPSKGGCYSDKVPVSSIGQASQFCNLCKYNQNRAFVLVTVSCLWIYVFLESRYISWSHVHALVPVSPHRLIIIYITEPFSIYYHTF